MAPQSRLLARFVASALPSFGAASSSSGLAKSFHRIKLSSKRVACAEIFSIRCSFVSWSGFHFWEQHWHGFGRRCGVGINFHAPALHTPWISTIPALIARVCVWMVWFARSMLPLALPFPTGLSSYKIWVGCACQLCV